MLRQCRNCDCPSETLYYQFYLSLTAVDKCNIRRLTPIRTKQTTENQLKNLEDISSIMMQISAWKTAEVVLLDIHLKCKISNCTLHYVSFTNWLKYACVCFCFFIVNKSDSERDQGGYPAVFVDLVDRQTEKEREDVTVCACLWYCKLCYPLGIDSLM